MAKSIFKLLLLAAGLLLAAYAVSSCAAKNGGAETTGEENGTSAQAPQNETSEDTKIDTDYSKADWTSSIKYAYERQNGVSGRYTDPARSAFELTNENVSLNIALTGDDLTVSAANTSGGVYAADTMDVYILGTDGKRYSSALSSSEATINTFRLGYYYYDTHVFDQRFVSPDSGDEEKPEPVDILSGSKWSSNMTSTPRITDGVMSYTVSDATDPYIMLRDNLSVDASVYNAIEITIKTQKATSANFYIVAGSSEGYSESQNTGFTITADGEFHTYTVLLDGVSDYSGTLRQLRIDCGAAAGEVIEVSSIKAVRSDAMSMPVKLERNYHTYSDKLHEEIRFVAASDAENIAQYGIETRIAKADTAALVFCDKNGEHGADALAEADGESIEYIAFDINEAGIFGFIMPKADSNGSFELIDDGEYYVVRHVLKPSSDKLTAGASVSIGDRVYTDETHSFDGIRAQAYIERNPLTAIELASRADSADFRGYDPMLGAYVFSLDGTGFNEAYEDLADYHFKVTPCIKGDDVDRNIYIYTTTANGGLECAALLDQADGLLPIQLEVSKNFCGEYEEPFYYPDDTSYGDVVFPITLAAGEAKKFTVINLYQNWGAYPLKQLSSIQFHISYYHLSMGVTETNCIAPYFVYGKDGWVLPDFRGISSELWPSQPQHYSYGRLYWPSYLTDAGDRMRSEVQSADISSAGPVYADISNNYLMDDGAAVVTIRHMEMPQTDETRTYYTFRFDFIDNVTINDVRNKLELFATDGRISKFKYLGYLDADGNETIKTLENKDGESEIIPLGAQAPYFSLFDALDSDGTVNFGLIVKSCNVVINGVEQVLPLALKNAFDGGLNYEALTFDTDTLTFAAGDSIELNVILLPFGDYNIENDDSVRRVRADSVLSPYALDIATGSLVEDTYLPRIMSDNGKAEFTISGGANNAVVRVDGFASYVRPALYVKNDAGEWEEYKTDTYGYDGIQCYYNEDGTYSFAFVCPTGDGTVARSYKVEG